MDKISTVLVADDEAINRQAMRGVPSDTHAAVAAARGKPRLEKARRHHPDPIPPGIPMPEMDGYAIFADDRGDVGVR